MKKLLVVLGLLLLLTAISASAQAVGEQASYFVDYYSNNINPLAADQVIRAINVGTFGTPLTSIATGRVTSARTSTYSTITRKWSRAAHAA
jgi:hypothetical protein